MRFCGHRKDQLPTSPEVFPLRSQLALPLRSLVALFFCLFLIANANGQSATTPAPETDQGIRVAVALNCQIHIDNQFGDVNIEVTNQNDLLVQAAIVTPSGVTSHSRSPVVIERRNDLILISAIRDLRDSQVQVNLSVYLPATARVEIITSAGAIISRGVSSSLSLKTISGKISANVGSSPDLDVVAQSTQGRVRSVLGTAGVTDEHSFRFRFGSGNRSLRVSSQRGDIELNSSAETSKNERPVAPNDAPRLRGAANDSVAVGVPATQAAAEEVEEGDVIRVDTELVNMNFSVVDRGTNRGVAGLRAADFKLFEDGVEQQLLHFDSSAAPFDLVLLIDLSGSTREVVKLIRTAARDFVDAARPSDRIAIITFAGQPAIVSPLTLDRGLLRQRVEAIDTMRGDTKLYDATGFALSTLVNETRSARRTAIVIMSDGLDGSIPGVNSSNLADAGSKLPYKELANNLREFDGVVYTLWLNTYYEALNPQDTQPEAFQLGHDRMRELAEAGGGVFYEVDKLEDLAGAYERVVADLGTVYSLAYRPVNKNRDGKWRSIRVVVDRALAVARGKHGYYAN